MNKLFIIIFDLFLFLMLSLPIRMVLAQRVELYLEIENPSVSAGEAIKGTAVARVYGGNTTRNCNIGIDFGDSTPSLRFPCTYNPNTGGTMGYVECAEKFTHVYTNPGDRLIRMYASCGGHGPTALRSFPIHISSPPTSPLHPGIEPGVSATNVEEITRRIIRIIYWIFASIAFIMILIGGFLILTSAGNPQRVTKGKLTILYSLGGLGFITLTHGIINLVYAILEIRR